MMLFVFAVYFLLKKIKSILFLHISNFLAHCAAQRLENKWK